MDEAASRLRMEVDSKPEELDALDREILQMQIEARRWPRKTTRPGDRLERWKRNWPICRNAIAEMTASGRRNATSWPAPRAQGTAGPCPGRTGIAKREGNLAKAGELSTASSRELEKQLAEAEGAETAMLAKKRCARDRSPGGRALDRHSDVDKMLEGEREKLLRMEDELHNRVIGQDQAVRAVSNAVRRARAG